MTYLSDGGAEALAVLASEWFKAVRRLRRLTLKAAPAELQREQAQQAYSCTRVEDLLMLHGLRLVVYDGLHYGSAIVAEPVNADDFSTDEGLVVAETLEPTVLRDGRVIARGRVVLAEGN